MRCIAGVILFVFNLVQVIPADEESCKIENFPDEEVNCILNFETIKKVSRTENVLELEIMFCVVLVLIG